MASSSGGGIKNEAVALEFQLELNSLTHNQPPVSKEKINQIVRAAIKEIRNYKHVVYFVEDFIKKCPREYKVTGLYVLDAIIRNCKSQPEKQTTSKHHKEVYTTRFSKNICKTFSHLYSKSTETDREKISRVLALWQKYSIFDSELIDRLNRISSAASIDSVVHGSGGAGVANSNGSKSKEAQRESNKVKKFKRLQYLQDKLSKLPAHEQSTIQKVNDEIQKLRSELLTNSCPNPKTNRELSEADLSPNGAKLVRKLLNFDPNDDDDDSYSDSELLPSPNKKHKSSSGLKSQQSDIGSLNLTGSERLETSITNCAVWLQQENLTKNQPINLPDLSQPPPPLLMKPAANQPPLPPQPPPQVSSTSDLKPPSPRDRQRRGLPNIRANHICICSKTLWLGHLAKCTTEDYVIEELAELLSPSSSNDKDNRGRRSNARQTRSTQNIIVDCQIIPPRGCAYVEFVDRKTASKCLERMKDGYRLEGNAIKVAWATNKGIAKDRHLKSYWNVEVGCTYVPWSDLPASNTVDFLKWAEGGLVDEESLPPNYLTVYKKQMVQLANADEPKQGELQQAVIDNRKEHDMELDDSLEHANPQNPSQPQLIPHLVHQQQQQQQQQLLGSAPVSGLTEMQKNLLSHLQQQQRLGPQVPVQAVMPGQHPHMNHAQFLQQQHPHHAQLQGKSMHHEGLVGHHFQQQMQQQQQQQQPQSGAINSMPPTNVPTPPSTNPMLAQHLNPQNATTNEQSSSKPPSASPSVQQQQQQQHLINPQLHQQRPALGQHQPYTIMHMPQHFQLVQQRPNLQNQHQLQLLQNHQQVAHLAALNASKPGHLNNELLSSILANVNGPNAPAGLQQGVHDQLHLIQQSQNQQQQQQQRMNLTQNMQRNPQLPHGLIALPGGQLIQPGQHLIQNPMMVQFLQQQQKQGQLQQQQFPGADMQMMLQPGVYQMPNQQQQVVNPAMAAVNKVTSPPVSSTTAEPEAMAAAPKPLMDLMSQPISGLIGQSSELAGDSDNRRTDLETNGGLDNSKEVDKQRNSYGNMRNSYDDRRLSGGARDYYDRNNEARQRFKNDYDRGGQRSGPYERDRRPHRDPYDSDRRGYRNDRGSNDRSVGRYESENQQRQQEDVTESQATRRQEIAPSDVGAVRQMEGAETKTSDANGDLNENHSGGSKDTDVVSDKQVTHDISNANGVTENGTSEVKQTDVCVS